MQVIHASFQLCKYMITSLQCMQNYHIITMRGKVMSLLSLFMGVMVMPENTWLWPLEGMRAVVDFTIKY
jgi:hypothetical protein